MNIQARVLAGLTLGLLAAMASAQNAQTCRNDISATAPDNRFSDNGDGTVTDLATGLIWKQCAEGLSGAGCSSGTPAALTWKQALQRAAEADYAGRSDWRLPNKNELASLIEERCHAPAINTHFFPNTLWDPNRTWPYREWFFWSSSDSGQSPRDPWGVAFHHGNVDQENSGFPNYVRLVRGGQ